MKDRRYLSTAMVFAMFISAIISAAVVLYDTERPDIFRLLWMLPVTFGIMCFVIFYFKQYLFTRYSVTIICGLYWMRMVVNPFVQSITGYFMFSVNLGGNTSFYPYMDEAFLLLCYDCMVVFIALALLSPHIANADYVGKAYTLQKYSQVFYLLLFGMIAFIVLMIMSEPKLLRQEFIPVWGAPEGWAINETIGQSLDGSGSGPLGVLVTLIGHIFFPLQILGPPVLVGFILRSQNKRNSLVTIFLILLVIGAVFIIATEERSNSIACAVSLLIVSIMYIEKRIRKILFMFFPVLILIAVFLLWMKTGNPKQYDSMQQLSIMTTAYFPGTQNVAASIEAGKNNPLSIIYLPADIIRTIPYGFSFCPFVDEANSTHYIFNRTLYGFTGRIDMLLPAIGQGYMFFGFILAPIIPVLTMVLAIKLEKEAQRASDMLWKNIWYIGTYFMSLCVVNLNLGHAANFMFYILFSALIAYTALPAAQKRYKSCPHKVST